MNAIVSAAAGGELPAWSVITPKRREHIERVATLMDEWAAAKGLDDAERTLWRAAGWLHDALRDANPQALRPLLPEEYAEWPDKLLHGPAAAERLRADGVTDETLLRAVAYHTVGHADFDELGRALYLADYLEPGRKFDQAGRAALRARMPHETIEVLRQVLRTRMAHMVTSHNKVRRETAAFWNSISG
jgi:HD superfamily phosphohydrolase YqeK